MINIPLSIFLSYIAQYAVFYTVLPQFILGNVNRVSAVYLECMLVNNDVCLGLASQHF